VRSAKHFPSLLTSPSHTTSVRDMHTDTHTAKCLNCGRVRRFRSAAAAAQANPSGRICTAKIRKAQLDEARTGFTASQQAKADQLIRDGGAVEIAPGLYEMASSDGEHTYASDGHSCVCPSGWSDQRCYHLLVARVLGITSRCTVRRSDFGKAA
jgi:hypothetical protein